MKYLLLLAAVCVANASTTFYYHGSIQNVINGLVPEPLGQQRVNPAVPQFAFSVGTPTSLPSMGNMITVNGIVFTRDTNQSSPTYYKVRSNTVPFLSTSSLYILPGAVPDVHFSLTQGHLEFTSVTQSIFDLMKGVPHCYYGLAQFSSLQAVALSKSPIYGQNIFKFKNIYFSQPQLNVSGTSYVALMGCAANLKHVTNATFRAELERVLYVNPFSVAENITTHVEILQLTKQVERLDQIELGMGVAVGHMLSQSVVTDIEVDVFAIGDLQPLPSTIERIVKGRAVPWQQGVQ